MHYVTFWKGLKTVAELEKLAASDDPVMAKQAQMLLATTCDETFAALKSASPHVLQPLMQMRDAHRITGEKLAASPDVTAELVQKLAVATFVDDHLEAQLEKLSGAEYDQARAVQLLGREYAVKLMRGLFA
jgi:hypothetical protein